MNRKSKDKYLEKLMEDHDECVEHVLNGGKPDIKKISKNTRRFLKDVVEDVKTLKKASEA